MILKSQKFINVLRSVLTTPQALTYLDFEYCPLRSSASTIECFAEPAKRTVDRKYDERWKSSAIALSDFGLFEV